ncbi:hypothetical protein RIF29_20028 [Crotalaria pallida]|uniref:Cupin type-1 domain-containing protein n=1 Tax=Crotalaria pallida TaxID=3830 RepID=A0AAN9F4R9_CROPI
MTKPFLLYSSLCLLLFTSACLANTDRLSECQLNRLNALEPDNRIETEAGTIETWNSNHPELRCAGVAIEKLIIEPEGLHLPSYTNYPQLIMIVQGEGALGISVPGCSETFEEPQSQPRRQGQRRRSQSQEQEQQDSHQKIRHFREGDIIAIPPGIAYWSYNYGNQQIIAINLLDITNIANQLDPNPRRFYIAGNPEEEHPETQEQLQRHQHQQQQQQSAGGRRRGQHQQEEQQEEEKSNVLSGFDPRFLSQAFNVDEELINKLQNPSDRVKQIVRVKRGLSALGPERQEEEEEEEEEEESQHGRGRRQPHQGRRHEEEEEEEEEEESQHGRGRGRGRREWEKTTRQRHSRGEEGEEEEEEETTTRERRQHGRGGRGQREEEEEEEEEQQQGGRRGGRGIRRPRQQREEGGRGSRNGIEETICTAKLRENIARPSEADLYNPEAGRISTVNSLTLPILRWFQLSAQHVKLYRNGIYAPHWNIDANSVIYVTRGSGWVQVVNCQGNSVYNDKLRRGQVLVVPQNFVVAHQAGEDGFEFIAFKTNDRAITSPLKQVFRAIPAEVLANAFGLRLNQVSELKYNGNQGPLVSAQSESEDHTLIKVA